MIPSHVFVNFLLLKPGLQMQSYDGCMLTQIPDDEHELKWTGDIWEIISRIPQVSS